MSVDRERYLSIQQELEAKSVQLVAVSKTKPVEDIQALYDLGQRDFGENYVQELVDKATKLPNDIRWHFIGHLQSNKAKFIAPFVYLIHGVDSLTLLKEINKQAIKNNRNIDCLLQVHIAMEETKFGLNEEELNTLIQGITPEFHQAKIRGLMGMASFTEDMDKVKMEFRRLKSIFDKIRLSNLPDINMQTLSMGMSSDYRTAIDEGSNLVRIGSLLFGHRS